MTEDMLNESVLLDKLPDDILSVAMEGRTSIGNNPALPDVFDENFIIKAVGERFSDVRDALDALTEVDGVDADDLETILSSLMIRCQELERPMRDKLEKLCFNYVVELFQIPSDSINMNLKLTDSIDYSKFTVDIEPVVGSDDSFEFDDVNQITDLKSEVYKRRLLNCLSMGAGMTVADHISDYVTEIGEENLRLAYLYKKILLLNDYLLFTREDAGISDENKMLGGTASVRIGTAGEMVEITVQAKIFPILLCETVRALFELFSSHGLPGNVKLAKRIIGRADFIKAEPWDMRIGPYLWNRLLSRIGDCDMCVVPYLFRHISRLRVPVFNDFFREVFAGTKKGREMAYSLYSRSLREYESSNDELAPKVNTKKTVITDDILYQD